MKKIWAVVIALFVGVLSQLSPAYAVNTDFVSIWNTENLTGLDTPDNPADDSSPLKTVTLPLVSNGNYNFTVNWGDSSSETITTSTATHIYATGGIYTVTISGQIEGFSFANVGDRAKLLDVSNWGSLKLLDGGAYFQGAVNFNATATDAPDTTSVTSMQSAFHGAEKFNGAIGNWDVSHVTHMGSTFEGASVFNQDISSWNVSNVEIFRATFYGAQAFNKDISSWNVSKAWHFGIMFENAYSFNQNLATWDIASGGVAANRETQMDGMLSNTSLSTQNYGLILKGWAGLTSTATMATNASGKNAPNQFQTNAQYPDDATVIAARTALIDQGWVITDGGLYVPPPPPPPPAPQEWRIGQPNDSSAPVEVSTSARINATFTNMAESEKTIDEVYSAGNSQYEFVIAETTCLTTLAPLESCTIAIDFTPAFEGDRHFNLRAHAAGDETTTYFGTEATFRATGGCQAAGFAGGTGTIDDPYLISNEAEFACMNAYSAADGFMYFNKSFKLTADLDFGGVAAAFPYIGSWWTGFEGDFDGDGHSISGAVMNGAYVGIFPWISGDANIKNLNVISPIVNADWYGGVITSYVDGAATFTNLHVTNGQVTSTSTSSLGGLVGYSASLTMTNSSFSGTVSSSASGTWSKYVGGLIAYADGPSSLSGNSVDAQIRYSKGSLDATAYLGGLIAYANQITISESTFSGSVRSDSTNADTSIGGFVASAAGGTYSNNGATASILGAAFPAAIGSSNPEPTLTGNIWNISGAATADNNQEPGPDPSPSPSPSPSQNPSASSENSETSRPEPQQPTPQSSNNQDVDEDPIAKVKRKVASAPESISAEDLQSLEADYVKVLPVSKISAISAEALAALTGSQAKLMLAKQTKVLDVEQLQALSPKAIAALRPTALAAIDPAKLKVLTPAQKAAITKKQLKALDSKARKALGR